jgi:hypothetical protein
MDVKLELENIENIFVEKKDIMNLISNEEFIYSVLRLVVESIKSNDIKSLLNVGEKFEFIKKSFGEIIEVEIILTFLELFHELNFENFMVYENNFSMKQLNLIDIIVDGKDIELKKLVNIYGNKELVENIEVLKTKNIIYESVLKDKVSYRPTFLAYKIWKLINPIWYLHIEKFLKNYFLENTIDRVEYLDTNFDNNVEKVIHNKLINKYFEILEKSNCLSEIGEKEIEIYIEGIDEKCEGMNQYSFNYVK